MSLLDRKLMRDLSALRGQVITIALVVGAGVAVFVASISTYDSLRHWCERFYAEARMPRIFVTLKRAPLSIVTRMEAIPGVAAVSPRIVRDVIVDWPGSALPVSARTVSLSRGGDETLARLYLRRGVAPGVGDVRDAAVNEAFAEANGLRPGMNVRVLLNGRVQDFRVTGIALSPEYAYAVKPGLPIPDDRLYAILWIDRRAAEVAFDMKGAFNDVVVSLAPGADPKPVIAELDRLLKPYGSVGAIELRDQLSNRFLQDELNQQRVMSVTIPFIFFAVSAFLLNVALARVVAAQREQIAALKALGFPTAPLALHYIKLVLVIVLLGSAIGVAGGFAFGSAMIESYRGFFRLPELAFTLTPWSIAAGAGISLGAACLGVLTALQDVVGVAPAVAMRPLAPRRFRQSWLEIPAAMRRLDARRTLVVRNMTGRPLRTITTIMGIAVAVPMVVLGLFWRDALDRMIHVQFNLVERGNVAVTFTHPLGRAAVLELARLPGVLAVEGERIVPVRLRAGHRSYLTSIVGLPAASELRRPHDAMLRPIEVPADGVTLTRSLAERLGVTAGDLITIEVMEGRQRQRQLPVSAIVDEAIGMGSYMNIDTLDRLTDEGDVVSAATLYVDATGLPALSSRLKQLPTIEAIAVKAYTLASFLDKIAGLILVTAGVLTGFAIIIAVGVVYNGARIGLQERAFELASLRILGFTRAEIARLFLGEFAIEIAVGIPCGLIVAKWIVGAIARVHSNESFRIPATIEPRTYVMAALVVLAAALASAFAVRRRIDRLDLVSIVKARE